MAYAVRSTRSRAPVDQGYFFMKIKIGQPGTQAEMLEKDMARLSAIHAAIGDARTPYSSTGKLPYYFDANGRYESKDALLRLLDHAKKIGAFDQIALIEEPFPRSWRSTSATSPRASPRRERAHRTRMRSANRDGLQGDRAETDREDLQHVAEDRAARARARRAVFLRRSHGESPAGRVEQERRRAARAFPGWARAARDQRPPELPRLETMRSYHPARSAVGEDDARRVRAGRDYYARSGGVFDRLPHYEAMFAK